VTWWGALALALSLYGVVVLLEWIYDQIMGSYGDDLPAVSVVVRATNQEHRIEQTVRELLSLFNQRQWERRSFEVVITDGGSSDQTHAILDRLARHHPFLNVVDSGLANICHRCRNHGQRNSAGFCNGRS